ncbi:MAG: ABC transporter permease subunit, partial [Natronosporangium sp.]
VAARRGKPRAAGWLRTPLALAFRLQRASLIGWGSALTAMALLYGSITQPIVDGFEDLPGEMVDVLGGDPTQLLDGFVSTMGIFDAVLIGVFAILGVQALRGEETRGRAEPVLATATSRWAWLGGQFTVLAAGTVGLLLLVGLALGVSTAISVGDGGYAWDVLASHLVYAPALLVFLALAVLLYGVLPRAIGATWAALGFALIVGFFGPLMDLPGWVHDLSPMEHIARLPLDPVRWPALLILTVIAAGLAVAGLAGFRRRDLETK